MGPRHPRWPLALLLVGTGLATVAVIDALSAVRSQQRVADGALRDYASFALWSYQEHLREAMRASAREVIGAVNHGDAKHIYPMIPDATDLATYLPFDKSCVCRRTRVGPSPAAFFGFNLHADTLGVALNNPAEFATNAQAEAAAAYPPADRAWIVDTLRKQVHSGYRSEWGFTYVIARHGDRQRDLVYTLMPTAWGDTLVYGAEYAPQLFSTFIGGILDGAGLLPPTFTRRYSNRALLLAQVVDARENVLFASDPRPRWQLDAQTTLATSLGGVTARAEIRPELANQLVIGGLPRSHLPFLLALLALAAGLSVVAVAQLRREGELGRLRADFVANVSHELRTPLAQIRLDLDTIRLGRHAVEAQRTAALDRVDREARRLTYLAENVLRFSRRGRADGPTARLATDIAAETSRVVEEFRPLAAGRRATIETAIEDAPIAYLDRDAIRQLVLNLLDNAIKYGPPGQTVRVGVRNGGATVRLTVADDGPGVPPDERELIWQPFRRGAGAVRQGVGGSGMGLTIVREIAEQHGGRAFVDASGFTVELPVA